MDVFPPDSCRFELPLAGTGSRFSSRHGCVALRSALQSLVRTGAAPADVRRLVDLLCGEARRAGLHAEQMLVTLKAAWRSIPEVYGSPRDRRDELLDEIITACIEEFYHPDPRGQTAAARAD